jgi:excinuclease ABC subunit C
MPSVSDILHSAPHQPGVYLMKNKRLGVFYVGKAKDLHKRMHQYINPGGDDRLFVQILDRILDEVEFFITATEKEALILENTLIKKFRPRYNVRIKDDKNFFSLRIDLAQTFPRLEVVRSRKKDKALYFGPYSSAGQARQMIRLINKHFMLRDCTDAVFSAAKRPCLRHQMGRCHGPCSLPVDPETYAAEIRRVKLFLEGRKDQLIDELTALMHEASENMEFERAAQIRDQLAAISGSVERQVADLSRNVDWDVIGFARTDEEAICVVLRVRGGVVRGRDAFPLSCRAMPDLDIIESFLQEYYQEAWPLPEHIVLPFEPREPAVMQEWLSERRERKVTLSAAERGVPARLLAIANANAKQEMAERTARADGKQHVLESLKTLLHLKNLPVRIECGDISNIQGALAVGSLVCFLDGRKATDQYRRYKITLPQQPDDFAMMREMLMRRFTRGLEENQLPDLLVVDGGKGQLSVALDVLRELNIVTVDVVSLAKSKLKESVADGEIAEQFEGKMRTPERVFLPNRKNPVLLRPGTAELGLLQQLRDEAHRFAITYHRLLRSKRNLKSGLLDIPGVGPKRARALLKHFGSLKRVREASLADIAAVEGFNEKLAGDIKRHLEGGATPD